MTGTAPNGGSSSINIQVTSTGPGATNVSASQTTGFAPMTVAFTVTSDRPIQRVEGNFAPGLQVCGRLGCFEAGIFNVSPVTGPLSFAYTQPGTYEARFNVVHADTTVVTKTVRIVVRDRQQLDQQLRAVWSEFSSSLAEKDVQRALQYLSDNAKDVYAPMLEALRERLPLIVASFSEPKLFAITSELGEYAIRRAESNGKTYMYLIYFQQGSDGVWRLESM